jgi:hypothetical protein
VRVQTGSLEYAAPINYRIEMKVPGAKATHVLRTPAASILTHFAPSAIRGIPDHFFDTEPQNQV